MWYPADSLKLDQPVYGPNGLLTVTAHTPGELVTADPHGIEVGDIVYQEELIGRLSDVFQAFHSLWSPMWNKHQDTTIEHWKPVLAELLPTIPVPQQPFPFEPISPDAWLKAVRHRRPNSATGPDGVTRMDLLNLGPELTQDLLATLRRIELGQQDWPTDLMVGLITSVEKKEGAARPGQFRPITVLNQVYRTWASIRAKEMLRWMDSFAPDHLVGNRPSMSPKNIWYALAQTIECCHAQHESLAGLVTDVVKAFNTIPRSVVAAVAIHLGIPMQMIKCWFQAVDKLQRRFVVNGACGPPEFACTGYPEGDGLSVCAMALLNVAMHWYVGSSNPNAQILSYVDNWEIMCVNASEVALAFRHM